MAIQLLKYEAPSWCSQISKAPPQIIRLAQKPTNVENWKLPRLTNASPTAFHDNIFIKRDDLTGSTLGGNKIRKLEFIVADAVEMGSKHLITCGAVQSNHCRAVSNVCAMLGFTSHLFLRSDEQDVNLIPKDGNYLLNILAGANQYIIPRKSPYKTHILPKMKQLASKIMEETGELSYLIPVGGSDPVGVWGYIDSFHEIRKQVGDSIDDIVCVCGSGGTAAGLSIANCLAGSPYRIHGISVCDGYEYFMGHIDEMITQLGLTGFEARDIINIHDDYVGLGYGRSQPHELEFISRVARTTGIFLDTVYTGKAAYGLSDLLQNSPRVFKGRNILFIHSGGAFGIQSAQVSKELLIHTSSESIITNWSVESFRK